LNRDPHVGEGACRNSYGTHLNSHECVAQALPNVQHSVTSLSAQNRFTALEIERLCRTARHKRLAYSTWHRDACGQPQSPLRHAGSAKRCGMWRADRLPGRSRRLSPDFSTLLHQPYFDTEACTPARVSSPPTWQSGRLVIEGVISRPVRKTSSAVESQRT